MPELNEAFQRREREIAAAVASDAGLAERLDAMAVRRRRGRHAGIAASAVVAVAAVIGGVVWFAPLSKNDPIAPVVSPTPTVTSSENPSPSASVTADAAAEPALIEGFAPVPQLTANEIPWDEVGPGWFLVDYRDEVSYPVLEYGDPFVFPQSWGGLSLVSPDGQWFATSTLDAVGEGLPLAWDGVAVWIGTSVTLGPETGWYDLAVVDLKTSASLGVIDEVPLYTLVPIAPSEALAYAWGGDGLMNQGASFDAEGVGGCWEAGVGYWGWAPADMSFLYSSARGGQLVCFGPAEDPTRTAVTLVNVKDVGASRKINEFQYDIHHYTFLGWIDDDRFLFARTSAEGAAEKVFVYDLADDSIAEAGIDVYSAIVPGSEAGFFDRVSQRHVISRRDGDSWSVDLYRLDGSSVATLGGACTFGDNSNQSIDLHVSGERLMVTCPDPGYVAVYDLESGAELGRWDVGTERSLEVFGHPNG